MNKIYDKAQEAAQFLEEYGSPTVGVIQGTGLENFHQKLVNAFTIQYADIPHMPLSQVESHKACCTIGNIGDKTVITFQGRLHYYEGYSMQDVTFPVRIMQALGVQLLLMSNASGGLNPTYSSGDLVIITDHISTMPDNPLRGVHDPRLGVMFPDMNNAYDQDMINQLTRIFEEKGINPLLGIYLGLPGPSLETPAEYKLFRQHGADILGMSTVPEVIVAKQAEIRVGVISVVTNTIAESKLKPTVIDDVIAVVKEVEPTLIDIMESAILS